MKYSTIGYPFARKDKGVFLFQGQPTFLISKYFPLQPNIATSCFAEFTISLLLRKMISHDKTYFHS